MSYVVGFSVSVLVLIGERVASTREKGVGIDPITGASGDPDESTDTPLLVSEVSEPDVSSENCAAAAHIYSASSYSVTSSWDTFASTTCGSGGSCGGGGGAEPKYITDVIVTHGSSDSSTAASSSFASLSPLFPSSLVPVLAAASSGNYSVVMPACFISTACNTAC